ncbi:[citrate (pro-3S)-lyase] ligase [Anaerospora hongkongensis]|uniref:[citrate (pro-3S)-lyase] ligase n=1 Tax=Anaerospora hongkongensis TaxID=244830 RepID=UPI00289D46A1|nr:[citrate (pro-3S)-lyase] ligase [Anaerospora hongkongensis]
MQEFHEARVFYSDRRAMEKVERLLAKEGIQKDDNLEYTMGIYRQDELVATGSFFKNTLRCLAVDSEYQGEGLLNKVLTHLLHIQFDRGNTKVFLYTKGDKAKFFADLGFYEIASVDDVVVFMENRATGFSDYLADLAKKKVSGTSIAAIVVNANPFTLGHQYVIEQAAQENDVLHIFVVSEDVSIVPFAVRYDLVQKGTAHLSNVVLHKTGNYLISNATFPSYFLKDADAVIEAHARLDIEIFKNNIARCLEITKRYLGEEPFSHVTGIYNAIMKIELEKAGIACIVLNRKLAGGEPISASKVRQFIHDGDLDKIKPLVPQTTYDFFQSAASAEVIKKIQQTENVIHY